MPTYPFDVVATMIKVLRRPISHFEGNQVFLRYGFEKYGSVFSLEGVDIPQEVRANPKDYALTLTFEYYDENRGYEGPTYSFVPWTCETGVIQGQVVEVVPTGNIKEYWVAAPTFFLDYSKGKVFSESDLPEGFLQNWQNYDLVATYTMRGVGVLGLEESVEYSFLPWDM